MDKTACGYPWLLSTSRTQDPRGAVPALSAGLSLHQGVDLIQVYPLIHRKAPHYIQLLYLSFNQTDFILFTNRDSVLGLTRLATAKRAKAKTPATSHKQINRHRLKPARFGMTSSPLNACSPACRKAGEINRRIAHFLPCGEIDLPWLFL